MEDEAEDRTQAVQQKAQTEGVKEGNQSRRSRRVPKPSTSVNSDAYRYTELYIFMRAGVPGINNIVIVSKLSFGHVIAESARKE
jgi:hypothetical protein